MLHVPSFHLCTYTDACREREREEGIRLPQTNSYKNHDKMNNIILQCKTFLKRIYNVVPGNIHDLYLNFEITIITFLKSLQ